VAGDQSAALKLGYKASAEQFSPRQLLEFAVVAEEVGFDSVVVSDHFQPWRHTGGHAPFAPTWLGAVGERTHRIMLGTSVLTPTFRYHPAVVAQAMGTLACLFPGRVMLGVGTGEAMNESPLGIAWPESPERFARLKEAIELIQQLWSSERVSYEGSFYRTRNATIYDRPATPLPLYVAASGPAAARLAGRVAQGFICTSGKGADLYTKTLLPALREGAEKAGRDYETIDRMIEMKVSFDMDENRARENTRFWSALALSAEEKVGLEDAVEMERRADALPLDRVVTRWIVSSDPEKQLSAIKDYVDMGFNHLVFHAPGPDQKRFLRLYSEQVLPKLREMVPAAATHS
jgi:coenzyme F420-dependent glucose-6-phosphate dehydrogenase